MIGRQSEPCEARRLLMFDEGSIRRFGDFPDVFYGYIDFFCRVVVHATDSNHSVRLCSERLCQR